MLREEYNRLERIWTFAKPEQVDSTDWNSIWKIFTRNVRFTNKPTVKYRYKGYDKVTPWVGDVEDTVSKETFGNLPW
jgi:hypothetical protein